MPTLGVSRFVAWLEGSPSRLLLRPYLGADWGPLVGAQILGAPFDHLVGVPAGPDGGAVFATWGLTEKALWDWSGLTPSATLLPSGGQLPNRRRAMALAATSRGELLWVYSHGNANPSWRLWTGNVWTLERPLFTPAAPNAAPVDWLDLYPSNNGDVITAVYSAGGTLVAVNHDSTGWLTGTAVVLTNSLNSELFRAFAAAPEQTSGRLVIFWSEGAAVRASPMTGSVFGMTVQTVVPGFGGPLVAAGREGTNRIMLAVTEVTFGTENDVYLVDWNAGFGNFTIASEFLDNYEAMRGVSPTAVTWAGDDALVTFALNNQLNFALWDGGVSRPTAHTIPGSSSVTWASQLIRNIGPDAVLVASAADGGMGSWAFADAGWRLLQVPLTPGQALPAAGVPFFIH